MKLVRSGEPRLFPRNPWSSWLTENPAGESRRGFRVLANNYGPFLASRPHRRALCLADSQDRRQGLPLMSNSNRFRLSDSLVDNPQLVNAGGAVGRASATRSGAPRDTGTQMSGHGLTDGVPPATMLLPCGVHTTAGAGNGNLRGGSLVLPTLCWRATKGARR